MIRKLMIVLLSGAICMLTAAPLLAETTWQWATPQEYEEATGNIIEKFNEAPMLRLKVAAGELPPVEERIGEEPLVIKPFEEIGTYGGTMRMYYGNPFYSIDVDLPVFEQLFYYAPDGKTLFPNIAKGWELSSDAKTFTIYLREGMKWSDGVPFSADDLVFWYEDVLLNDTLTPVKPKQWMAGGEMMELEKVDDWTVKLHFAAPYPSLIYVFALAGGGSQWNGLIAPKHYLKNFHPRYTSEEDLEKLCEEKGVEGWWNLWSDKRSLIGLNQDLDLPKLGAWIPVKTSTTEVMFERNPYFWKVDTAGNQLPYIDRREGSVITDREIVKMKIMAGEIDDAFLEHTIESYPLYMENRKRGDYRVFKWESSILSMPALWVNQNAEDEVLRQIFQDVRFRRALSLAINREEISELCRFGMGEPRQATVLPRSRFYEEEFERAYAEYDLERANQLLDEVGLKWDKNHQWRLRPDGKTLAIILEFASNLPLSMTIELIKEYWQEVGVKVALKSEPSPTLFPRVVAGKTEVFALELQVGDTGLMTAANVVYPSQGSYSWCPKWRQWYDTDGEKGTEPPKEVKKVFELFDKVRTALSEEKRIEIIKEILRLYADNVWIIGTVGNYPLICAVKNNLGNVPEESIAAWEFTWAKFQRHEQFFWKK